MKESSGNELFFVRLVKVKDDKINMINDCLEIACWQTSDLSKKECLERAWLDASDVAKFLNYNNMDQVELLNMTNEEIGQIKSNNTFF